MKPILKTALALALPLALAACGGGGGDNNAPTDKPPVMDQAAQNAGLTPTDLKALADYSTAVQPSYNSEVIGFTLNVKAANLATGNVSKESAKHTRSAGFSFVDTIGSEYLSLPNRGNYKTEPGQQIADVDIYQNYRKFNTGPSYKYFIVSDEGYTASQFGIARTDGSDPIIHGFFRGHTTPATSMPNSGSAQYSGEAILLPDLLSPGSIPVGAVAAGVDFGRKSMTFSIATHHGYKAAMDAKIAGSAFMGKSGTKTLDGFFTGNAAGEMVGEYFDLPAGIAAVFGAKRQ